MVDVVTSAIRSQAQKAQQQISQQQKQLARQRDQVGRQLQRLGSAQVVRTLSRQARELQSRQLGSTQQQIRQQTTQLQTSFSELERIRNLPTAQDVLSAARSQLQGDLKVARRAIRDKSIAVSALPKSIRDVVQEIREGQTDTGIIKAAEARLGQSLSAIDRQIVLDLAKGITPTEISLQVSLPKGLRELPITELPTPTEIALKQSLPTDIRDLPVIEVKRLQTITRKQDLATSRKRTLDINKFLKSKRFEQAATKIKEFIDVLKISPNLKAFQPASITAVIATLPPEQKAEFEAELEKRDVTISEFFEVVPKIIEKKVPKAIEIEIPKVEKPVTIPVKIPALFAAGAFRTVVPETIGGIAGTAAFLGAWDKLPNLVKTGVGTITSASGVNSLRKAQTPEEFGAAAAEIGIGGLILAPRAKAAGDFFVTKKPVTEPVPSELPGVKPFVRQRAVVRIIDKDGNVAFIIDRQTNRLILPGGDIKPGETPKQAAIRELKEELLSDAKVSNAKFKEVTGIDINKLVKIDEVLAVPGENQIVYQVRIDKLNLDKLKLQSNEAKGLVTVNSNKIPKNLNDFLIGKKATLFSRKTIRTADLVVNSRAEKVIEIEKTLKTLNKKEKTELKSLAGEWAEKNFGKGFAKKNKISKDTLIKDYLLAGKGEGLRAVYINPIEQTFLRRGKPVFLKERIPARAKQKFFQRITRKKPGVFKKFQKVPQIVLNIPSRYDVPRESAQKFSKFAGEQFFVRGSPSFSATESGGTAREGDSFKVLSKFFQRGEKFYFFQPPRAPGKEGFLAVNYLGIGGVESPRYGFTVFGKTPVIQILKGKVGKEVVLSKKALAGKELEVGAPTNTVFKVVSELRPVRILGKKVRQQIIKPIKIKAGELSQKEIESKFSGLANNPRELLKFQREIKKQTGIEYDIGFQPTEVGNLVAPSVPSIIESRIGIGITPSAFKPIPSKLFKPTPSKPFKPTPSKPFKPIPSKPVSIPSKPFKPVPSNFKAPPSLFKAPPSKPPKFPPSKPPPIIPSKPPKFPPSKPPPIIPSKPPPIIPSKPPVRRRGGKPFKPSVSKFPRKQPGYFALVKPLRIKRRGKKPPQRRLIKINKKPATKQRAKDALFWTLDQSLATTGRIVKSKKPAQRLGINIPKGYSQITRDKFREFKIVKGKRIFTPNRFIEIKGRPRLDTLRERQKITALALIAQRRKQTLKRLPSPRLKSTFGLKK